MISLNFLILSPFPLHFLILSPFSYSLSIFLQPGCQAATSCATLNWGVQQKQKNRVGKSARRCPFDRGGGIKSYLGNAPLKLPLFKKGLPSANQFYHIFIWIILTLTISPHQTRPHRHSQNYPTHLPKPCGHLTCVSFIFDLFQSIYLFFHECFLKDFTKAKIIKC